MRTPRSLAVLRGVAVLALGTLGSLGVGCAPSAPSGADGGVEADAAPPGFPLTLVLHDGRELVLKRPVERVLAGNAGALDLLLAVAPSHVVAGINAGTRPYSVALARGTAQLEVPEIPHFDMESVAVLAPDLVLTHAWQTLDKGPFLERLGVPTLELGESRSLEQIERDLTRLAAAVGTPERADEVVAELRARLARLAATDRSSLAVLSYSSGDGGGWSSGAETTDATYIGWAGMTQLTAERGLVGHFQVDHELLLDLDPAILVVPSDDGTLAGSRTWRSLSSDERLAGLRVRSGDGLVVPIDSKLTGTTSHHLLEAAEALARAVDAHLDAQNARK